MRQPIADAGSTSPSRALRARKGRLGGQTRGGRSGQASKASAAEPSGRRPAVCGDHPAAAAPLTPPSCLLQMRALRAPSKAEGRSAFFWAQSWQVCAPECIECIREHWRMKRARARPDDGCIPRTRALVEGGVAWHPLADAGSTSPSRAEGRKERCAAFSRWLGAERAERAEKNAAQQSLAADDGFVRGPGIVHQAKRRQQQVQYQEVRVARAFNPEKKRRAQYSYFIGRER
jgi:hypothetical protein